MTHTTGAESATIDSTIDSTIYRIWSRKPDGSWTWLATGYPTRESAQEAAERMAYLYPVTEVRPEAAGTVPQDEPAESATTDRDEALRALGEWADANYGEILLALGARSRRSGDRCDVLAIELATHVCAIPGADETKEG